MAGWDFLREAGSVAGPPPPPPKLLPPPPPSANPEVAVAADPADRGRVAASAAAVSAWCLEREVYGMAWLTLRWSPRCQGLGAFATRGLAANSVVLALPRNMVVTRGTCNSAVRALGHPDLDAR